MIENGLYQLWLTNYKYLNNLKIAMELSRQHNSKCDHGNDDDLHALTLDQMIRPFYLIIGLLIISLLVLIGEVIFFKWIARRNRTY